MNAARKNETISINGAIEFLFVDISLDPDKNNPRFHVTISILTYKSNKANKFGGVLLTSVQIKTFDCHSSVNFTNPNMQHDVSHSVTALLIKLDHFF